MPQIRSLPCWPACHGCGRGITEQGRSVVAAGNHFHPDCLACSKCGKRLTKETGFFQVAGKIVCADEVNGKRRAEAKDNMKCDECGEGLVGSYFQHEGKNLCEKDYDKHRKKCTVCGESIVGSYYTDKEGKITCAKDYKEKQGGNLDCFKCGKEVSGGEIVRAVDALFHTDCFSCVDCGRNLSGKDVSFLADEQKNLYCRDDYHRKFSPKCHGCEQPIAPKAGETSASRLKALNKDWHPECFKCADCKEKLGGDGKQCYPLNEVALCMECHKKRIQK